MRNCLVFIVLIVSLNGVLGDSAKRLNFRQEDELPATLRVKREESQEVVGPANLRTKEVKGEYEGPAKRAAGFKKEKGLKTVEEFKKNVKFAYGEYEGPAKKASGFQPERYVDESGEIQLEIYDPTDFVEVDGPQKHAAELENNEEASVEVKGVPVKKSGKASVDVSKEYEEPAKRSSSPVKREIRYHYGEYEGPAKRSIALDRQSGPVLNGRRRRGIELESEDPAKKPVKRQMKITFWKL